jgi:hypothetical protein
VLQGLSIYLSVQRREEHGAVDAEAAKVEVDVDASLSKERIHNDCIVISMTVKRPLSEDDGSRLARERLGYQRHSFPRPAEAPPQKKQLFGLLTDVRR